MRFDEPKLTINSARDFREQVGRVRIRIVRGLTDRVARRLAKSGQSARYREDMLVAVGDPQRIGNEKGLFGCDLHGSLCGAAERSGAFRKHIRVVLDHGGDLVEQFMDCNESRTANIPMRLLYLPVQVDRSRQMLVQQLDGLTAYVLDNVLCVGCMVTSPFERLPLTKRR